MLFPFFSQISNIKYLVPPIWPCKLGPHSFGIQDVVCGMFCTLWECNTSIGLIQTARVASSDLVATNHCLVITLDKLTNQLLLSGPVCSVYQASGGLPASAAALTCETCEKILIPTTTRRYTWSQAFQNLQSWSVSCQMFKYTDLKIVCTLALYCSSPMPTVNYSVRCTSLSSLWLLVWPCSRCSSDNPTLQTPALYGTVWHCMTLFATSLCNGRCVAQLCITGPGKQPDYHSS